MEWLPPETWNPQTQVVSDSGGLGSGFPLFKLGTLTCHRDDTSFIDEERAGRAGEGYSPSTQGNQEPWLQAGEGATVGGGGPQGLGLQSGAGTAIRDWGEAGAGAARREEEPKDGQLPAPPTALGQSPAQNFEWHPPYLRHRSSQRPPGVTKHGSRVWPVTVCTHPVQCQTPLANGDGIECVKTLVFLASELGRVIPTLSKAQPLGLLPADRLAAESPHPVSLTFVTWINVTRGPGEAPVPTALSNCRIKRRGCCWCCNRPCRPALVTRS